jgi:hypothetical protein
LLATSIIRAQTTWHINPEDSHLQEFKKLTAFIFSIDPYDTRKRKDHNFPIINNEFIFVQYQRTLQENMKAAATLEEFFRTDTMQTDD